MWVGTLATSGSVGVMLRVSKMLAPVDFSLGSKIAVEYAAALAKELNSVVTLFHVNEMPRSMNAIVPGADNTLDAGNERAAALRQLEALRAEVLDGADVEMPVEIQWGSPATEIVAYALGGRFDMIVMGTHGRTGIRRTLMGSVADMVVRHSMCPVLTVHLPLRDPWA